MVWSSLEGVGEWACSAYLDPLLFFSTRICLVWGILNLWVSLAIWVPIGIFFGEFMAVLRA